MNMFDEYSYKDYLDDFSLHDKLQLIHICDGLLSKSQMDILQPFEIEVTPENKRLMVFIHNHLLYKKPQITNKESKWIFDPATEAETLSSFIQNISIYKTKGISLNLLTKKLRIKDQQKRVNLNHKGIKFLLILLDNSPESVPYKNILEFVDSSPATTPPLGVSTIRTDLFSHLKDKEFDKKSIEYLKNRTKNQEKVGYSI